MAKSASLEIHQINVSQGDSTLVILRDLTALKAKAVAKNGAMASRDSIDYLPFCMNQGVNLAGTVQAALLIDGGNDRFGDDLRQYLVETGAIDENLVYQKQLEILVTHFHDDHQDGIRSILMKRNPLKGAGLPRIVEAYRPKTLYKLADTSNRSMAGMPAMLQDIASQVVPPLQTTAVKVIAAGGRTSSGMSSVARERITLGASAIGVDLVVSVVAADRAYFTGASAVKLIPQRGRGGKAKKTKQTATENDHSIAVVVEYGSFRHFCGADIGGPTCPADTDVETPLGKALPTILPPQMAGKGTKYSRAGHCCSMKLSHHGSRYSNDEPFVATLTPAVALVSSGFRLNSHRHPTPETIARLLKASWKSYAGASVNNSIGTDPGGSGRAIFATEIASLEKKKPFDPDPGKKVSIMGTIVLRPTDESVAAVRDAAKTGIATVEMQVFGDGGQTPIEASEQTKYALRAVTSKSTGDYKCGPFTYTCAGH